MADLALAIRVATETFGTEKLGDVEKAMGGLGQAASAAKTLLPGAAAATAGLGAALGASVGAAAEFEKTMDGALAVMSPADVNTFGASLENLALRLGKDTSFSAKEAAAGIEELVKGGLSAADIMNGAAESTLALAAAGGVSLPDAATIAANALAQFSLKGTDMAHVSDLIAGAANASAIDVNQFKFSLQAAGAVAATVGFNFDDLATGIAVMGKAGIAGSDAGTSLKTMMLNLQPTTKAQIAEFRRLGITGLDSNKAMEMLSKTIEGNDAAQKKWAKQVKDGTGTLENLYKIAQDVNPTMEGKEMDAWAASVGILGNQFFDAQGKVKPMAEIAGTLQGALKGMTEAQKLASLEILFGSDAIRAGAILSKEGAEGFREMAASMGEVKAADVASARLDNLAGSTEQLKGSLETVGITIGKIILPAARSLTDAATGILNGFLSLSPEIQRFITYGLVAATAIGAVATVALTLVAILPTLVAGFGAAATIAGVVGAVLTGPVLLAIGAVVAAVALLTLAWNSNFLGIQDAVRAFWEYVSPVFGMVADALNAFSREVAPEASLAWANLTATAQAVWGAFIEFFTPVFASFKADWMAAWPAIQVVATAAFTTVDTVIRVLWEVLKTWILTILKVLQGDWKGAWEEMRDGLTGAWKIIDDRIRDVLPKLKDFLAEQWGNVLAKNKEIWDSETGTIPVMFRTAWSNIVTAITGAVGDILNKLGELAKEAYEKAKEIGSKIIDGIKQAISDAADGVSGAIRGVVEGAIKAAQDKLNSWKPSLPSIPLPSLPGRGGGNVMGPLPAIEDSGAWVSPLSGPVTQEFGKTPYSSVYANGLHSGIDIGVPVGRAVVASRSGRVDIAGWDTSGYGNLVAITSAGGFRTLYAHLSNIGVRPGQEILSGQLIGETGNTGNSSGPHLHFEVRESGQPVNPRRFVGFGGGGVVPGPLGANTPVMAHGGEVIFRPDQAEAMGLGIRRGIGAGGGITDAQMRQLAGYVGAAVATAMANMSVRMSGGGFADAVVGAIVDGTRRGRLAQGVNEAFAG